MPKGNSSYCIGGYIDMEDIGRIKKSIVPGAIELLYGSCGDAIDNELKYMIVIDKAHVLMLCHRGLLSIEQAKKILETILFLEKEDFLSLRGGQMSRGIYMLYENYIINKLGIETGGRLQLGRSRNDHKATYQLLKTRAYLKEFLAQVELFLNITLDCSEKYNNVIMPLYTHYQPAMPITYGHYLGGIIESIIRDIDVIFLICNQINASPLGACAGAGTSIPIDSELTARLLGFERSCTNSVDAVASRDYLVRIISILASMQMTISRVCEDFLLWTSSDFNFVVLPDELVGGSSIMPNKRNAFIFENIQGRCSTAVGLFASAVGAMASAPFTNSISVGTEAVSFAWGAFDSTLSSIKLLGMLIEKAVPNDEIMFQRIHTGQTLATEYANRLVMCSDMSFREAHRIIGNIVAEAVDKGEEFTKLFDEWVVSRGMSELFPSINVNDVVTSSVFGGGAGSLLLEDCLKNQRNKVNTYCLKIERIIKTWNNVQMYLDDLVEQFLSGKKLEVLIE